MSAPVCVAEAAECEEWLREQECIEHKAMEVTKAVCQVRDFNTLHSASTDSSVTSNCVEQLKCDWDHRLFGFD